MEGDTLCVQFSGEWTLSSERCKGAEVARVLNTSSAVRCIQFETAAITDWDTGLLLYLLECRQAAAAKGVEFNTAGLPDGATQLLNLSESHPKDAGVSDSEKEGSLASLGRISLEAYSCFLSFIEFLGELTYYILNCFRGKGRMRRRDLIAQLEAVGPNALPIVCLLSFLMGLIIAFIGVLQLQKFAADIYVADLVGLALTRELGALMAGIILAGRTGAAFAAQIASMRVNEEINALTSFGISPMQFLVLPRVLATTLMMPLLYTFSCFIGILGGMVVSTIVSNVTMVQYYLQVEAAVGLNDFFGGLIKSCIFGIIIALAGCYRGLHSGNDATAVGHAATSAVVTAITWIVIADAVFAVIFNLIGF